MLVDRITGRISAINLPDFGALYSAANWYRDYAAYCGVSDGSRVFAIVTQLNRRKPVLRKLLSSDGTRRRSTGLGTSGAIVAAESGTG